ncbi:MAG: DciA family protein [Steroidobacteraceae bacterium]
MPKPPLRDNPHSRPTTGSGARAKSKPLQINELLARHGLGSERQNQVLSSEEQWYARWQAIAPPPLRPAVVRIVDRRGRLVFYVSSASWASRLRLELPTWWPTLIAHQSPAPSGWRIQIQPTAASTGERA